MTNVQRSAVFFITITILAGLGVWLLLYVNPGLGAGLIGGTIGGYLKQKRIKELQAKGLNPYDERAYHIAGKASYATLVSGALLAALVVLIGSIFAPVMMVNPFDLLGYCIAIVVFLYVVFYYYYNRIL